MPFYKPQISFASVTKSTNAMILRKIIISFLLIYTYNCYSQIQRESGINLIGVNYYSIEYVFTDAFKQSRAWVVHEPSPGSVWNSGVEIPVDENGYPTVIPFDNGIDPPQIARAILFTDSNGHNPSGTYRLIVSGSGQVRVWGAATEAVYTTPIDVLIPVDATQGRVFIEIEESLQANPITDIKFILPEYVDNYQTEQFTTEILDFIEDFQTIRFMDWSETNFSENEIWNERTPKNNVTQAVEAGVAWEYVIDLCNTTQKNAWINIPHRADDNYISELATLFRDNLNPNLKIYIEYSNELWNATFTQYNETAVFAENLGYTGTQWERARKYTAKRSADIFHGFETVFQNNDRLIKVIPGRASNGNVTNEIISYFNDPFYNPNQVTADAIAIAPYFGNGIGNTIGNNGQINTITVSEILDLLENELATAYDRMDQNKAVANTHNLELIAYEAGQHLVAQGTYQQNDILTVKLTQANRDPRMEDMYCQYINYWYEATQGGLLSFFSSHQPYGRFGSWGIKEYMDEEHTPKYDAITDCVFNHNTLSTEFKTKAAISMFPNPIINTVNINTLEKIKLLDVYTIEGKKMMTVKSTNKIDVAHLPSGIYILKAHTETTSINNVLIKK